MKRKILLAIGVIFSLGLIVSAISSDEEVKPVDFCDTILTFDGDIDDVCAKRFEKEIRQACNEQEPNISENECVSQVTLLLIEDCVNTEKTLGIDKNVCIYKKMKNFKDDLERWLK